LTAASDSWNKAPHGSLRSTLRHECGLHAWIHHGLVAIFLASLCVIFYKQEWLSGLDSLLLQAGQGHVMGSGAAAVDGDREDVPVVVMLSQGYYQAEFGLLSPLDREKLHGVLNAIIDERPDALAIDLDISPWLQASPVEGKATTGNVHPYQPKVDALLREATQTGGEGSEETMDTILVSPLPLKPIRETSLFARKLEWLQAMCGHGIRIGNAEISERFGIVTRYPLLREGQPANIGRLAHAVRNGDKAARSLDGCSRSTPFDILARNDLTSGEPEHRSIWQDVGVYLKKAKKALKGEDLAHKSARPINTNAYHLMDTRVLDSSSDLAALSGLEGRVVFLGGQYDERDKYLVPGIEDPIAGVKIHAAEYYSHLEPVAEKHALAYLLEIGIGVILGFVFGITWTIHHWVRLNSDGGLQFSFVWMLINLAIFGLVILVAIASSGMMLNNNLWLSPAPLLIGVFAKNYITGIKPEQSLVPGNVFREFFFGHLAGTRLRRIFCYAIGFLKIAIFGVVCVVAWIYLLPEVIFEVQALWGLI